MGSADSAAGPVMGSAGTVVFHGHVDESTKHRLLADAIVSFDERCASGIEPVRERMAENLHRSLMLVTCLNPYIGYDNAARVAKKAYAEGTSLREACLSLGLLTAERFDEVFHPEEMV